MKRILPVILVLITCISLYFVYDARKELSFEKDLNRVLESDLAIEKESNHQNEKELSVAENTIATLEEQLEEIQVSYDELASVQAEKEVCMIELVLPEIRDDRIYEHYNIVEEAEWQLDTDEDLETVKLLTQAYKDENGEFHFDDGQKWMITVEDGDKIYRIYEEYVQLGALEVSIFEAYNEDQVFVHLVAETVQSASFEIFDFSKSLSSNVFTKETKLDAIGINFIKKLDL